MAAIQKLWSTQRRFRILAMIFGVALVYLLPFLVMPGTAAIFLKMDGIEGEVVAKGFEKTIQVNSAQWGVGRGISSPYGGGGRETSAPSVSEMTVTKPMDKSSVPLFTEAVVGQQPRNATLYFTRNVSGIEVSYYEILLSDVLVSSFSQSSGGDIPSESFSLNFTKIRLTYTPTDPKGGKGTPVVGEYDLTNTKTQ